MLNETFLTTMKSIVPAENILLQEPMSKHTTFRLGGPADAMVLVENKAQLAELVRILRISGQEFFLLGNGSNLLVGDRGYRGIILKLAGEFQEISCNGTKIHVGAAAKNYTVAQAALDAGLTGFEFAAGIPGTIGGGVVMNAGAYDGEMKQVVESVGVLSPDGEYLELDCDTMEFGYRTSAIRNRNYIVTDVVLRLTEGDPAEIKALMDDLAMRRKSKQPLEYPSAGSTFKRPEGYFAGKLIMDAGMRGFRIGGAQVSEKHCGFVVNAGGATASDVKDLVEQVTERVKERFGVALEREIIYLGDF